MQMTRLDSNDEVYNTPAYSVVDTAKYLHIPTDTLRNWLRGSHYSKDSNRSTRPLIQCPEPGLNHLSFINLVEAHVLRSIQQIKRSQLENVRHVLDELEQQIGKPHPLARVEFQTDGVHLFAASLSSIFYASHDGQSRMSDVLNNLLSRLEWNQQGIASKLFPSISSSPRNESKSILIDPQIAFGYPVVAGTRIPTQAIAERYEAGELPEVLADDFRCELSQIHAALRFQLSLARAA